jgi:ABC-type lipoprotein release transport system permease subunit
LWLRLHLAGARPQICAACTSAEKSKITQRDFSLSPVGIARNLFTSGQFGGGGAIQFTIPWAEVLIVVGLAFVVSMFMTWWPARQASRVPVADALRYE